MKTPVSALATFFAILLFTYYSFAQVSKDETLKSFVKLNAFETSEVEIIEEIVFFLNNSYSKKKGIQWSNGSITTSKNKSYDKVLLKFNVIDNTLFLKHEDRFYRFSSEAVSSFEIIIKGENRTFLRGYHTKKQHMITGNFRVTPMEIMEQITSFPEAHQISIESVEIDHKGKEGRFTITSTIYGLDLVYQLQSHLRNHADIYNVKIDTEIQSINEGIFFEKLFVAEEFELIKMNSKKLSVGGSVSLVKTGQQPVFEDLSYYVANHNMDIFPIVFSKKAVVEALSKCGVQLNKSLASVNGEKNLIKALKQLNK